MNLSRLLVIHATITAAAGVVLIVAPAAIPGAVGIHLDPNAYLVSYMLGAAELAVAFLSFFGRRFEDGKVLRFVTSTLIVFHAATAAIELYALARGVETSILANVALRILVIVLFVHYGFRKIPVERATA